MLAATEARLAPMAACDEATGVPEPTVSAVPDATAALPVGAEGYKNLTFPTKQP